MPFQVTVREIKPRPNAEPGTNATTIDQVYEQTVETLDLQRVLAAVNHKPRTRKVKTPTRA